MTMLLLLVFLSLNLQKGIAVWPTPQHHETYHQEPLIHLTKNFIITTTNNNTSSTVLTSTLKRYKALFHNVITKPPPINNSSDTTTTTVPLRHININLPPDQYSNDILNIIHTSVAYNLTISIVNTSFALATVKANTIYGVSHALETLLQLFYHNSTSYPIHIEDKPNFPWR